MTKMISRAGSKHKVKQTLLIHIGWHKTATSFIQLYLDRFREELKKYDICYPVIDDRPRGNEIKHSYLYLSIINQLNLPHLQQDLPILDFDELFDLSVREITGSGCRWAIISEEGLSEATPGIAKLMGRYKDHFDNIKIIGYIRRQDYLLESLYSQFVKQKPFRNKLYLDDYILQPKVRKRGDYDLILNWWAEEFGENNILVAPFERQTMVPDPLTCFFDLCGLPAEVFEQLPVDQKKEHITPPREVTEFFRHMNLNNSDYFIKVLTEYLLKSGAPITNTKYFCRADREKILQEYESSNKNVARKYLKRDDGILFNEPIRDFDNCPETWRGFKPVDLLNYALPISGKMSVEISVLRHEISMLKKKISRLEKENLELRNENQRINNIKKTIYRFLKEKYRKVAGKVKKTL